MGCVHRGSPLLLLLFLLIKHHCTNGPYYFTEKQIHKMYYGSGYSVRAFIGVSPDLKLTIG